VLKLACVNCGAPLEIGPDLDTFACGYCGSQQRVERKGGVVALQRVETAIKAVQRGTDRTAAELALPRLKRELEEVEAERAAALKASSDRRASAVRGRRKLSWIVFFVVFFGGPLVIAPLAGKSDGAHAVLLLAWLVGTVAAPVFVYRKTKLPTDEIPKIKAKFDPRIERLKAHLDANRTILDQLPH